MVSKALILVVDDNESLLLGASKILGDAGYETITASTGAEGLRLVSDRKPNLILLDVVLPDLDGYEVCRQIRSDIHLVDCGVILISGIHTDSEDQSHGLEVGADGFIIRPVPNRELLARVESLIRLKRSERALRDSESKFKTVADFTYDWEYWIAPDASLVYVSPSCERITGYSSDAFMKNPKLLSDIVHPGDLVKIGDHLEVITDGGRHAVDYRIITRSGEERWIGHECQAVFDDDGHFLGRRGSNRDITTQKYAEQVVADYRQNLEKLFDERTDALAQSELKFRSIFENSLDGLIFMSPDGKIQMANLAACKILGRTESEIRDRGWEGVIDPTDARLQALLDQRNTYREVSGEINFLRADGSAVPVDLTSKVFRLPDGLEMVIVGFRDFAEKKASEKLARDHVNFLQSLMEATPVPVFFKDGQGKYLGCNPSFESFIGRSREEIVGKTVYELSPKELADEYHNRDMELFQSGGTQVYEFAVRQKDGSDRQVVFSKAIFKDSEGNLGGLIGAILDITDRKKAEAKLRESEERFRALTENTSDLIWEADAKHVYTYMNPRVKDTLGYNPEEVIGKTPFDLMPAEEAERVILQLQSASDSQLPLKNLENWNRHKDGRLILMETSGVPFFDAEGTLCGYRGIDRDITDRKKAEEALRKTEERFRVIAETVSDSIWLLDKNYLVDYVSPFDEKMRGFKPCEVLGKPIFDTLNPDYVGSLRGAASQRGTDEETNERTGVRTYEAEVVCKDGSSIPAEGKFTPIRDNEGSITGFVGIMRDISERKHAEELAVQTARLKSVADLSDGVAHHFNNLLQIVMGGANLAIDALECGESAEVKMWLDKMLSAASRGAEMVKRLQAFAHTRVNVAEGEGAIFDVTATTKNAAEVSKPLWTADAQKKGINIELQMTLEDGCMIRGQENEIFEVVVNLLKNAAEALPQGGLIEVKTYKEADEVVIAIRDTGAGIPEEEISHVFQPFWTTKGFDIGKGMGLAVAHGLVKRHGGNISVHSRTGEGATFNIRFPLILEPVVKAEQLPSKTNEVYLNILVIDDEEDMAGLVETICSRAGHKVLKALSGEDGLRIFANESVDLVLCDLGMPGMSGWAVGKAIGDICRERKTTRPIFVLLTGWGGQELEQEKMVESGVDRLITKPISKSALLSVIREIGGRFALQTAHSGRTI